jgi:hypothetical protein
MLDNLLLPLQEPIRLFNSFVILCMCWYYNILFHMIKYQIKYGGDAGEDYFHMTKNDFHRKYRLNK